MSSNHIPRRSGIGLRQVLAPRNGRVKVAPHPFFVALKKRRADEAAALLAEKKAALAALLAEEAVA